MDLDNLETAPGRPVPEYQVKTLKVVSLYFNLYFICVLATWRPTGVCWRLSRYRFGTPGTDVVDTHKYALLYI